MPHRARPMAFPGDPNIMWRPLPEVWMEQPMTRRALMAAAATVAGTVMLSDAAEGPGAKALGEAGVKTAERSKKVWTPTSDRKLRVGIAGFGVCQFGAAFGFQDHPNVTVAAVTDLFPDRCAALAKACRCAKTYPSLEEMVNDDALEAIFVATDAPSHAAHCIAAMKRGKHVACAVPAVFGSVEDAHRLHEVVKETGRTYMMFETSAYHRECHAMRKIHEAGGFGKLVYSEGEYWHYMAEPIASFKDWRVGLPPQWYPTHSNAYHACVGGGRFTEVSCVGVPSILKHLRPENNRYKNPFGTEVATFRTSDGAVARMGVSWDTPGHEYEMGRVRGERGSMTGLKYQGLEKRLPDLEPPALPPTVHPGGHGGSHGHLMHEFVTAVIDARRPYVDVGMALNMTVAGIVAHASAIKGGEWMKVPDFA
jgi:predicted dehydrogenase